MTEGKPAAPRDLRDVLLAEAKAAVASRGHLDKLEATPAPAPAAAPAARPARAPPTPTPPALPCCTS